MAHKDLAGSSRPAPRGAVRTGDIDPATPIELTVTLKGHALEPIAVPPRPPLDPAAFAERYGAPPAAVEQVTRVLGRHGLTLVAASRDRRSLRVRGTAAQVQAAFRAQLGVYRDELHQYRAREGTIAIPDELEEHVSGVFGLDQRRMIRRAPPVGMAASPAGGAKPWGVDEIEERYRFPPGDGAGQVIGIVEFGFPMGPEKALMPAYLPGDLEGFCRAQGRPVPDVTILPVTHAPLDPKTFEALLKQLPEQVGKLLRYAAGEMMMDVEIVAGLCPRSRILVYVSTFDEKGWIDLLDLVLGGDPATPSMLSISYGLNEDHPNWSDAARREIELRLHGAALQGITVCASAGDDGSGSHETDGRAHVAYPASSPHVLAVGGTMLAGAAAHAQEVVWWEAPGVRQPDGTGGATGGGVSTRFHRPSWQPGPETSLNAGGIDGRIVPDVAALAGPPGYDIVMHGARGSHGGTSAAAPVWAALLARLAAQHGGRRFLPPLLYVGQGKAEPAGKACRDITQGNNASAPSPGKGYEAKVGFDPVSGWGVPDGEALLKALR
jgi:kumamolisin